MVLCFLVCILKFLVIYDIILKYNLFREEAYVL